MVQGIEKRQCRRFEIPGAEGKYKKAGILGLMSPFSRACPISNVSKGGLAFECEESFRRREKLTVQLLVPGEPPLNLRAFVRRQGQSMGGHRIVAVEFLPFGRRRGRNPPEALDTLRRLEADYTPERDMG